MRSNQSVSVDSKRRALHAVALLALAATACAPVAHVEEALPVDGEEAFPVDSGTVRIATVGRAMEAAVMFDPIDSPRRMYMFRPFAPRAVQMFAGRVDPGAAQPASLRAIGFFDGRCTHVIDVGEAWMDTPEFRSVLPAWNVPRADSIASNLSDPVLAFEPGFCPERTFARATGSGLDHATLSRTVAPIQQEIEEKTGLELEMHVMQGGTWTVGPGVRETWTQLLFTRQGDEVLGGGHRIIVGIRQDDRGEQEVLHWHGPYPGYSAVPFALADIDDDGTPEIFATYVIPSRGLLYWEGVAIIQSGDGEEYEVTHLVVGWETDMH